MILCLYVRLEINRYKERYGVSMLLYKWTSIIKFWYFYSLSMKGFYYAKKILFAWFYLNCLSSKKIDQQLRWIITCISYVFFYQQSILSFIWSAHISRNVPSLRLSRKYISPFYFFLCLFITAQTSKNFGCGRGVEPL